MKPLEDARERFAEQARERARREPLPWLAALRGEAAEQFAALGLPDTRQEEWRYTSLAALAKIPFAPAPPGGEVGREQLEERCLPVFACSAYVFVDGRFAPALSAPGSQAEGHCVDSLAAAFASECAPGLLGSLAEMKVHPFAALNTACFEDGALLRVPTGTDLGEPIHLVFITTDAGQDPTVTHPRVLIDAAAGSRAVVIQDHVSLGSGPQLTNSVCEVRLGADASLDLVVAQREGAGTYHLSNLQTRQQRDSRLGVHTLTLGGAFTRNDLGAVLSDVGADCTLNGLFLGTGDQLVDNHTLVDHAMPHGTSRQRYKGILGGSSRGVFRGRVVVRPDAQKTNASQQNPNLLLTERAQVNTKPQLEIRADDVRCSHGSTIGQLDPEALFYLRARGIDAEAARSVLTRGFAAEIIDSLPNETLAASLGELLLDRLEQAR